MWKKIGGILLSILIVFSNFLSFLFCWKEEKYIYSFIYFISDLAQNIQKSLCEWRTICPYDYANFQWKSLIFSTTIFLCFYDSLKNFTTQSFPFFPFVLKWHAEKFLVGWLWNIGIGRFARKCVRVFFWVYLLHSKRHSINVENSKPNFYFIEIIGTKKKSALFETFDIASSLVVSE